MVDGYPRDLLGYGRTPPDPQWPGQARVCVQIVLNYEEGGENCILHGDATSEGYLTDAPAAPLPGRRNMTVESIYEYGSRVGFWRLWRLFQDRGLPITVFGIATALRRNPEAVAAMNEANWEVASHGLKWIDFGQFSIDDERRYFQEAIQIHTSAVGSRPLGWYTGRTSEHSVKLVAQNGGFLYSADSYADELPYWVDDGGMILMVPYTLECNDMKFSSGIGYGSGTHFFDYLKDTFDTLYAEGETAPRMMSIGLHCRLVGRPGRIAALARFLDYVARHERVWFARRVDIARHWLHHHRPATLTPSRMNRAMLTEAYGDIFHRSPWVAEGAHASGLTAGSDTAGGLHATMTRVVRAAPRSRQLALLRSHPDLASQTQVANMTTDSLAERADSDLAQLGDAEHAQFLEMNDRYATKFGFPFIIAVKGLSTSDIKAALERRLGNAPDEEFDNALKQAEKIAHLRLSERLPA